jgi:hypothetical protein
MPRASRRRRRPPGRGFGRLFLIGCAATITIVLVAGSLLAVHTQSAAYRSATTSGYAAMATKVSQSSTRTGTSLSALLAGAPDLPDRAFPYSARAVLQQGLDAAATSSAAESATAAALAPPPAEAGLSARFASVMAARAAAAAAIRATVDQLLGLSPLPVAGAPTPSTAAAPTTLISAGQAAAQLGRAGAALASADAAYRSLQATARHDHLPFRLPPSAWVTGPASTAPLGPAALSASAGALASAPQLVPFHHLVITSSGLVPPAVPTGAPGTSVTSCIAPGSVGPSATPTVVAPTDTLALALTVTNCGTVPEVAVPETVEVVPADPAGTPPPGRTGGRVRAVVSVLPGGSAAPALGALPVSRGHRYRVTASVAVPAGQGDATGSTQGYLVQVAR